MSVPQWRDEELATLPDSPKRARPPGCATFSPLRRCSSVTDRCAYAFSSRLGATKNRQQRGMAEFLKRLPILSPVKKNGDSGNHQHSDPDVQPHQRAARGRFAATVRPARTKCSAPNAALAQKAVVMPLNQVCLHLAHGIEHDAHNN